MFHDWSRARSMPMNEWGDFLAGVFAPLAFFWLVLGYFQQGDELRQNTEALRLQADQLKEQVRETKLLVEEAGTQARASAQLAEHQAALLAHEERKSLPRFEGIRIFRVGNKKVAEDPATVMRVFITNVGSTITSLQVWDSSQQPLQITVDPSQMLATSKSCNLSFHFTDKVPDKFIFGLYFLDANAVPRVTRFQVNGDTGRVLLHGALPSELGSIMDV
jgi:hypothetical protein